MAEKVSKNFWTSPKCGITFVENIFRGIETKSNKKILLVRNPYSRIVSFYMNKFLFKATAAHLYSGLEEICDQCNIHKNPRALQSEWKTPFALGTKSTDVIYADRFIFGRGKSLKELDFYSFEDMISILDTKNPNSLDRHLHKQSKNVKINDFELIVKQKEINSKISEICNIIDIREEIVRDKMLNTYINKMPKNPNCEERVGFLKPHEMRKHRKVPSKWNWFYDEKTAEIVYRLYEDDFKNFDFDRDSWK